MLYDVFVCLCVLQGFMQFVGMYMIYFLENDFILCVEDYSEWKVVDFVFELVVQFCFVKVCYGNGVCDVDFIQKSLDIGC